MSSKNETLSDHKSAPLLRTMLNIVPNTENTIHPILTNLLLLSQKQLSHDIREDLLFLVRVYKCYFLIKNLPLPKQQTPNPHHRTPLFYRNSVIARHAHRDFFKVSFLTKKFLLQFVKNLFQIDKF
jgi:hypothetical protein